MKLFRRKKRRKINFNTYASRPVLQNRRGKNKIRNVGSESFKKAKKTLIILGLIALTTFGSYFLFLSDKFLITEIIVVKDEIEDTNNPIQHYFNSIKNKNILFIQSKEITEKVLNDHPEIQAIEVKKRLPNTLQIEYSEFPIAANLIQELEEGQKKYLVNSQGQVAKKDTENPNLPYIKITSEGEFKHKSEIIKPEKLVYILESIKYFEEKFGMKVFDAIYAKEARETHLRTEKYFFVWLDMTQKYQDQFIKLKKALVQLDIYNEPLEYIDLRIAGNSGEKVIFKKK